MRRVRISLSGFLLSAIQGLLAGVPIAISFYLFEAGASGRNIPPLLWAIPPGTALVSIAVSLLREGSSGRQAWETRRLAYEMGQINLVPFIEDGLKALAGQVKGGRANVMLIDTETTPHVLKIRYNYGMAGAPDLQLHWEKREGCCGRAWASGNMEKADLSRADREALERRWMMRPQNIECTRDIKSIICVPLRDIRKRDKIVGVMSCDSSYSLSESQLDEPAFLSKVEEHAETISRLIHLISAMESWKKHE